MPASDRRLSVEKVSVIKREERPSRRRLQRRSQTLEQTSTALSLRGHGTNPGSFCRVAYKLIFFQAEQNHAHLRQQFLHGSGHLKSIHLRHLEVKNNQIRLQLLGFLDGILAVRALATDLQIGTVFDHLADGLPHTGVSIDDK